MTFVYTINSICYSLKRYLHDTTQKIWVNKCPHLIIERHIGEDLNIGLGNYPTISKSTDQMLKYKNKYYKLDSMNYIKHSKLSYTWIPIAEITQLNCDVLVMDGGNGINKNTNDTLLLEFERIQPITINYKLTHIQPNNNNILQQGVFYISKFKPIGMPNTIEIDKLYDFMLK